MSKKKLTPLEAAIDQACGYTEEAAQRLALNIAIRKQAYALMAPCEAYAETLDDAGKLRFWSLIRDRGIMDSGLPPEATPEIEPMTAKRAEAFLREKLPFGKYAGQTVKEVEREDPRYLHWLAETPNEFQTLLKRYLARSKYKGL